MSSNYSSIGESSEKPRTTSVRSTGSHHRETVVVDDFDHNGREHAVLLKHPHGHSSHNDVRASLKHHEYEHTAEERLAHRIEVPHGHETVDGAEDDGFTVCGYKVPALLPHGSLAASGFNLASATLGAGTLALPSAMKAAGALLGSIFLACCCAGTIYSVRLLVITLEKTGYMTYEEMAHRLIGPKFEKLTAFLIVAFCWGITIVYVVAMGDILEPLTKIDGFPSVLQGEWGKRAIITIFWALFMLPLSLAKEINALRYASLIGMSSTGVLVAAIITHAAKDGSNVDNIPIANFNVDMIMALPIVIFSYCCQTNSFEIYTELKDRSVNRMTLATTASMGTCTLIYIIAGIAGVADFGNDTDGNILKNYKNPTQTAYIAFAFIAISLTLTMAFPICIFPTRDAFLQMMGFKDAYSTPSHIRLGVAGGLSVLSVIAGLFTPGIEVLFGVLGGICGSTLAFIWPALFILKTGEWTVEKAGLGNVVATYVLLGAGIFAGTLGTVVSIYSQATG